VQAGQPLEAELAAHLVEGAIRAAVGVADRDPDAGHLQAGRQRAHLFGDQVRLVVQQRRQRVYVDRPVLSSGQLGCGLRQRAAGDQRDPTLRRGTRAARRTGR
jgi:hypothetical protein